MDPGDDTPPPPALPPGGERAEPGPEGPELASTLMEFAHMFIIVGDEEAELDPLEHGPRFNPGLRLKLPVTDPPSPGDGIPVSPEISFDASCWFCCSSCC